MKNEVKEAGKMWKVLESVYLYKDNWLTARKDRVLLPNGNQIPSFYILEYPTWINVLAVTKDRKYIFVRQYRHGIQEVRYELCAGVCDPTDASPMEAAKRELSEETGYGKGVWREYMKIGANPGAMTNWTYCYLATDVELVSPQHLEDTEDLSIHILSEEEMLELLRTDQIKQSLHAAPLWKYVAENHLL